MGDRAVATARALVGARFRLHGRDQVNGLDCVGLILACYPGLPDIPPGYSLRGGDAAGYAAMLSARGLVRRAGAPAAGDICLLNAGAAQFHLGIWSGEGLIHADAMLRRVIETPAVPRWPLVGAWHWPASPPSAAPGAALRTTGV